MSLYILENKVVKQIDSNATREWLDWQNKHGAECVVAYTRMFGVTIRTRFEGCDKTGSNMPFIIIVDGRTMYGGCRAETWKQAEEFHQIICDRIENEKKAEFIKLAHEEHQRSRQ